LISFEEGILEEISLNMEQKKNKKRKSGDKVSRQTVKEEIKKSQADLMDTIDDLDAQRSFALRVLDQSNNVISFFKPIRNEAGEIQDFRIEYLNRRWQAATDKEQKKIIGSKLSEYYPEIFENGVFDKLTLCFDEDEEQEFQEKFNFNNKDYWFSARASTFDNGVIVFSKNITKEKGLELELGVQNKLLSEAEYVANVGSYKWNMDDEVIKYSDNAYRLFGYEPNEFEPTVEKFMSFVHPDDVSQLMVDYNDIIKRKERTESTYRIITKDKKVKTINSIGEFYQKDGSWHMVGVLADVTNKMNNELRLRNRNMELKRSNSELESFNRIASHDLQEPLRKIQMFVSRLDEEASDNLDDRAKQYLTKVTSSVERMRELITNLLSYSKIEKIEVEPEKIDLEVVLENVLDDLDERIEKTGAQITADSLPEIVGVQFQMEQLFANLIGNALKYKKPDTVPIIDIRVKILPYSKMDKSLALPRSRYLRLQFKDNGIGFAEEHQDKIFEIFQRLHSKNEFSGTGLGLAICKKIVMAHKGEIQAQSDLGEGAIFTVYLPYSA